MKIWNDEEVKALFRGVEECKFAKEPLRLAFAAHADKYSRKQNSVRNYYYKEVENLKKDVLRCKKLEISLEKHQKTYFEHFSDEQEKSLLQEIDKLIKSGMSVRTACKNLSGGDLTLMTRLQNKYQNLRKRKAGDNVIVFKQRQKLLTESEINSLFMGLVKLIKKTAIEEFTEKTRLEKESASYLLKKAFIDLDRKDKQISALKEEFEVLKKENSTLSTKLEKLSMDKNQILKAHLDKRQQQNLSEKLK